MVQKQSRIQSCRKSWKDRREAWNLTMKNKGQCCEAMVASAVQSPQSQRVLSRRIAERASLWIVYTIRERIKLRSCEKTAIFRGNTNYDSLAVRIRPALSFFRPRNSGENVLGENPRVVWDLRWHGIGSRKPNLAMTFSPFLLKEG